MAKRILVTGLLAMASAMLLVGGCGPSTDLSGTPIPNSLPDTRVTARPPDVLEAGFVVEFYWTGDDSDGRIAGYQWKMSDNGTDGISLQDTLTYDPATGDTLNPWVFTASTDSTFLVTADMSDFPGDPEGYDRSWQTHSFWVRAVDEDGGVDPTPAYVSFNATTLLPTVTVTGPLGIRGQDEGVGMPSTVTFLFDGEDSDFETGTPTSVRYLWKRAIMPSGEYANTRPEFEREIEHLVAFDDSLWSNWIPYDTNDDERRISLPNQPSTDGNGEQIYYLFAVQARDTAGAVSVGRGYGSEVANVYIQSGLAPFLRINEPFLGEFTGAGPNLTASLDIAAGQELNVSWTADAGDYAGEIVSFRYGWDVTDVTDPNDPNWALPPGNSPQHRRAAPISFASGAHTLTIQVLDNSDQMTRYVLNLNVVPVPDPQQQLPLLLVDDVLDSESNAWPSPGGQPLDRDEFRDQFWLAALEGPGGVAGFQPGVHVIDTEDDLLEYREVVNYRSLVWATKWVSIPNSAIAEQFRPTVTEAAGDQDKYVWLTPYQDSVGNLLLAGSQALGAFLAESPYELPIVFQSREGNEFSGYGLVNNITVRSGFGERERPDGTTVRVGLTRYPYETVGISTLDYMSPAQSYYEYGEGRLARARRRNACAAMKALIIDPDFKANYMPGGNVFPDTIWTEESIDWWDDPYQPTPGGAPANDVLNVSYIWSNDEFYNADVVQRGTNWDPQASPDFDCGGGLCVEPMFRSLARFDWVRDERLTDDPQDTWPDGYYGGQGQLMLDDVCGDNALEFGNTTAKTNDQVVAFIARKTAPQKPSQAGDVILGFDPYRFDNDNMIDVVRWVLGEHFGLSMNP